MEVEVLEYLRRFQEGEFNLLHVGAIYLAGLVSVVLAPRILPDRERLENAGRLVLAALAPLAGLILTSTIYTCQSCSAPPQCDIVTVGVPFPQEARERNPGPEPDFGPCWWSLSAASPAALFGNFALGTLGVPFLVTLLRPRRRAAGPDAGNDTGSSAGPSPAPPTS